MGGGQNENWQKICRVTDSGYKHRSEQGSGSVKILHARRRHRDQETDNDKTLEMRTVFQALG